VSTLLFVGYFPRRICAFEVLSRQLVFRVEMVGVWCLPRLSGEAESYKKSLTFWVGWFKVFER
jgi:hypothetical protein